MKLPPLKASAIPQTLTVLGFNGEKSISDVLVGEVWIASGQSNMALPLAPMAIRGAIWYQGEADTKVSAEYRILLPALINSWRKAFGHEIPFMFVQIAPHQQMLPEIRDAQLYVWRTEPKTAMAVITDYGDATNIHPKDKKPVGDRLDLAARAIAYGETITSKQSLWERATRVPLIISAPGFTQGQSCPRPAELLSIYPTLIDLCGLTARNDIDGTSLVPLMKNPQAPWDRPALTTHGQNNHSVRTERYRYTRYRDGSEELYDHQSDPNEWTNVATLPEHTALKKQLAEWFPKTNAAPAVATENKPGAAKPRKHR